MICRRHGSWAKARWAGTGWQEEADTQVRAYRAQHRRHQLELVILHPDDSALAAYDAAVSAKARLTRT